MIRFQVKRLVASLQGVKTILGANPSPSVSTVKSIRHAILYAALQSLLRTAIARWTQSTTRAPVSNTPPSSSFFTAFTLVLLQLENTARLSVEVLFRFVI